MVDMVEEGEESTGDGKAVISRIGEIRWVDGLIGPCVMELCS